MGLTVKQKVTKRKQGIETKNKILESSAALFARKGYDGTTVHEIASAVGIKESSLYNHFDSKISILNSLLSIFKEKAPESRPSEEALDKMLMLMSPEEIFKNILFYFGEHENKLVENIALIITNEKYKNKLASEIYYRSVVEEPSRYFERLIDKMFEKGLIKKVDSRIIAEQYNYVCIALTKEYFMAKNGLADLHKVVKYMVTTINFFCSLMKKDNDCSNYEKRS